SRQACPAGRGTDSRQPVSREAERVEDERARNERFKDKARRKPSAPPHANPPFWATCDISHRLLAQVSQPGRQSLVSGPPAAPDSPVRVDSSPRSMVFIRHPSPGIALFLGDSALARRVLSFPGTTLSPSHPRPREKALSPQAFSAGVVFCRQV